MATCSIEEREMRTTTISDFQRNTMYNVELVCVNIEINTPTKYLPHVYVIQLFKCMVLGILRTETKTSARSSTWCITTLLIPWCLVETVPHSNFNPVCNTTTKNHHRTETHTDFQIHHDNSNHFIRWCQQLHDIGFVNYPPKFKTSLRNNYFRHLKAERWVRPITDKINAIAKKWLW